MVFPIVMYGCESWTIKKVECQRIDAFKLWCWKSLENPLNSKRSNQSSLKEINPEYSLEGLMWNWSSNTLAIWCKELTHQKRPWCCKRLKTEREEDNRGWDGWMASPIQWTWTWANSGRWWRTGKLGVLRSMGSQGAGHDLVTEQQQQASKK